MCVQSNVLGHFYDIVKVIFNSSFNLLFSLRFYCICHVTVYIVFCICILPVWRINLHKLEQKYSSLIRSQQDR